MSQDRDFEDSSAHAVERYGRLVYRVIGRVLNDWEEARDAFQETFLRYHQAVLTQDIRFPKAWLCRTALYTANRRQEQLARRAEYREGLDWRNHNTEKASERELLLGKIRARLTELPERQREVFVLRNFEGMAFAEIGRLLDCSEEAARASEYKALKKIRLWFNDLTEGQGQ